jgi:hypothetical protein
MKELLSAETVMIAGHNRDEIEAYLARPCDTDTFGGVPLVLVGGGMVFP